VGCDVSPEMLAEAAANAAAFGLPQVELAESDDALSQVEGPFDLVHSFITFQHIPPSRGERIVRALLARLAPGGAAALHFTYHREAPLARKVVHAARRAESAGGRCRAACPRPPARPAVLPMYEYSLARLFEIARAAGAADVHAVLTDHGGHRGAMLVFSVGGGPPPASRAARRRRDQPRAGRRPRGAPARPSSRPRWPPARRRWPPAIRARGSRPAPRRRGWGSADRS
jgi:hypothetical protein